MLSGILDNIHFGMSDEDVRKLTYSMNHLEGVESQPVDIAETWDVELVS
jgi:hypothetical protein